jgi:hypothetical protein
VSDLLTTREAADLATSWRRIASGTAAVKVGRTAIQNWTKRGHLRRAGMDDRGRPLYSLADLARAEQATRAHALRAVDTSI